MSEQPVEPIAAPIELRLPREEAEALLLAIDALQPMLNRLRAEIAPEPPEAERNGSVLPDHDDALKRATWLARESLREARAAIGERRFTPAQRKAWQDAARRYVINTRRSVTGRNRSGVS